MHKRHLRVICASSEASSQGRRMWEIGEYEPTLGWQRTVDSCNLSERAAPCKLAARLQEKNAAGAALSERAIPHDAHAPGGLCTRGFERGVAL